MATKPTSKPEWTLGNPSFGTVTTEPSAGKKLTGWTANERPPYQFMNWLLYNMGTEWLDYFEEVTDDLIGLTAVYDAYVGSGGLATHATIALAIADAGFPSGGRILVISDLTLSAVQQITKNNVSVEFRPGVSLIKSSGAAAIQVSADGVRIKGGRISGYSGGGDAGIIIDAGSDYSFVTEMRFANCTADISDLAATSTIGLNVTE